MSDERRAKQLIRLVSFGVEHSNLLNDHLLANPQLAAMTDEQLTVAVTCYAAALAKIRHLSMNHFLALAGTAYNMTEYVKKGGGNGGGVQVPDADA